MPARGPAVAGGLPTILGNMADYGRLQREGLFLLVSRQADKLALLVALRVWLAGHGTSCKTCCAPDKGQLQDANTRRQMLVISHFTSLNLIDPEKGRIRVFTLTVRAEVHFDGRYSPLVVEPGRGGE